MTHTTGLLKLSPNSGDWSASNDGLGSSCYQGIKDESGEVVALAVAHDSSPFSNPDTGPNARRLVACWNACQGITTDNLEENGVAGMEMALALCNKIDLLAMALKNIVKSLSDQDDEGLIEHADQMIAARAALALVNAPL